MKKSLTIVIALALVFIMAACGVSSPTEAAGDTMTLEEIFAAIQKDVPNLPETATTALDGTNYQYYLFTETPIEKAQALACDAIINAVAHSAVLVRVAEGDDAQAIAETIRANANPNKWICVGAEATEVTVHNQTILLLMSTAETVEAMTANFDALWS